MVFTMNVTIGGMVIRVKTVVMLNNMSGNAETQQRTQDVQGKKKLYQRRGLLLTSISELCKNSFNVPG